MVTHVIGNRPQIIKLEPVWTALQEKGVPQKVVHTGQHYDDNMWNDHFKSLDFRPAPMRTGGGGDLGEMVHWLLQYGQLTAPVVVYGDTNSTLAGALAARERQQYLVHVEAGLRCGNQNMLEERNRIAVDAISQLNLCPNTQALKNVRNGFETGDVMYDVWVREVGILDIQKEEHMVMTLHRAEHFNDKEKLQEMLDKIRETFPETLIYFPIHPRTKRMFQALGITHSFYEMDPLSYRQFRRLLLISSGVITDSGGVSKEAVWAGKPLYLLRDTSEWPLRTVGQWAESLTKEAPKQFLTTGNGFAARRCADLIASYMSPK